MIIKLIYKVILSAVAFFATACGSDNPGSELIIDPIVMSQKATTDVIYEINPRFYGDSDCLNAITSDIPRIKSMNVNILWIMPPYEIGEEKSIGSPYCVKNYEKIDPQLGSMDDFKNLVKTAHDNGMRVLLDWVANHTSFDNPWTKDHPERYKKDANGNIASTDQWGDVAQLDYNQKSTREAMIEAMSFWVTSADVDGFRCDYAEGVPNDFWKEAIEALSKLDADIFMLAETNYTSYFDDGFYMIYDWNFPSAVTSMYNSGNITNFCDFIADRNAQIPSGKALLRYAFNHDVASENDVATMYTNQDGTILAYVLATFSGETPMLYSSMDVEGLSGKLSFLNSNHRKFTFSDKLTKTYGDINKAYVNTDVARGGEMRSYTSKDGVILCFANGSKQLLLIVNPFNEEKTIKTPIALAGDTMNDLITGEETTVGTTVTLPAFGYIILGN